jgi:hypothetical protein
MSFSKQEIRNVEGSHQSLPSEMKNDQTARSEGIVSASRLEEMRCEDQSIPMDVINERHKELLATFDQTIMELASDAPHLLERCLRTLVVLRYPRMKWCRLESRLEGWVKEHPEWTPSRLATTAQYYLKADRKMLPLLKQAARRVKQRVYMRNTRKGNTCRDEPMP